MVAAFLDREAGAGRVGEEFLVLGPVEEGGGFAEHGDDGEDLLDAAVLVRGEDGAREHGIRGELGHLAAQLG